MIILRYLKKDTGGMITLSLLALITVIVPICNLLVPPTYVNWRCYLFIALQHCPLRPPGWEFENPLAVPYVEDKPGSLDMILPEKSISWYTWTAPGSLTPSRPQDCRQPRSPPMWIRSPSVSPRDSELR